MVGLIPWLGIFFLVALAPGGPGTESKERRVDGHPLHVGDTPAAAGPVSGPDLDNDNGRAAQAGDGGPYTAARFPVAIRLAAAASISPHPKL